ncbi:thioredoxin family protein [Bacteroides ovatus]|jgi:thioredoxin-related protein|uniref:thioredoxin family protein n=1 Tax=Bacteroides ovatus TaxID=28116 RepID=UPI0022E14465|nr:thioredoxin family protein [Bacteroides ovatus]
MKKILRFIILGILTGWTLASYAQQQEGVRFIDNPVWKELLKQAQAANKPILIDCYTAWCGPCKMMVKQVFTQKEIGDYLNEHFVCAKIDMEKGEGPELSKKFGIRAYPTFLYLTKDGTLISSAVGGCNAGEFIERTERIMSGGTLDVLQAKYDKGERGEDFMVQYIVTLNEHMKSKEAMKLALDLLEGKDKELLERKGLYDLFLHYIREPFHPLFLYVQEHQDEFKAKYDPQQLDEKLYQVWSMHASNYLKYENSTWNIDEEGLKLYFEKMNRFPFPKSEDIILHTNLLVAEYKSDWNRYARICDEAVRQQDVSDGLLYNWASRISSYSITTETRKLIRTWLQKRIADIRKQTTDKNYPYIERYEQLLIKLNI